MRVRFPWASAALWHFALVAAVCPGAGQQLRTPESELSAEGVVADENHIIVFTSSRCTGPYRAYQLMASADGGRSWRKSGPRLEDGEQPVLVFKKDNKVWIVGENIAEGPAHDPFILISTNSPWRWQRRTIYSGPEELQDVALGANGEVLAQIKHIDIQDQDWGGRAYIHRSRDGGLTWGVPGISARSMDASAARFSHIEDFPHPSWRIANAASGDGFRVQHRHDANLPWRTIKHFRPQPCPDEPDSSKKK